jgi:hypothetical protein
MDALEAAGWPTHPVWIEFGKGKKRPKQARLVADEPMQYAEVRVAIVVPTNADRDWDNGVASLKPIFDGMVAAGIVVDDSIRRVPKRSVEFVHQAHLSKVVMRFYEVQPPDSLGL